MNVLCSVFIKQIKIMTLLLAFTCLTLYLKKFTTTRERGYFSKDFSDGEATPNRQLFDPLVSSKVHFQPFQAPSLRMVSNTNLDRLFQHL